MNMQDVIKDVRENTRGVWIGGRLRYNVDGELEYFIDKALLFPEKQAALYAYSEIPVPASQLCMADSEYELVNGLLQLEADMQDPEWLQNLADSI